MVLRLLFAHERSMVQEGVLALLAEEPWIEVVASPINGPAALSAIDKTRPLVAILQMYLTGLSALQIIRIVRSGRALTANLRVVVLSSRAKWSLVEAAFDAGAHAFVCKLAPYSDLVEAIRAAQKGRRYTSWPFKNTRITRQPVWDGAPTDDKYDRLTLREKQVLQTTAEGYSTRDAAKLLGVSVRTIETHRANITKKLGLHSRMDMLKLAIKHGMVPEIESHAMQGEKRLEIPPSLAVASDERETRGTAP